MKLICHNIGRLKSIASKVSVTPEVPSFGFISFYVTDKDTRILADIHRCRISLVDTELFSFAGDYDGPISFAIERGYLLDMVNQSDHARSQDSVLELKEYVTADKEIAYRGKLISDGGKRKLTVQMWPYSAGLRMTDLSKYRPAARLSHEELLLGGSLVRPVSSLLPRPDDISPFANAVLLTLKPEESAYAIASDTVSTYCVMDDPQSTVDGEAEFLTQYITPKQISVARIVLNFLGVDEATTSWMMTKDPTEEYGGKNNDQLVEATKSYCLALPPDQATGESKAIIACLGTGIKDMSPFIRPIFYNSRQDVFADREVIIRPEDLRDMADALMVSGHVSTKEGSIHQDFSFSFTPDEPITIYAKEKFGISNKVTMPEIETVMSTIQVGGDRVESFMATSIALTPFVSLLNQFGKSVSYDVIGYGNGEYVEGRRDTISTLMAVGKTGFFKEVRILIMGIRQL